MSQQRETTPPTFGLVDELLAKEDGKPAYDALKQVLESNEERKNDPDVLWRLARACHLMGVKLDSKNPKRKEIFEEGGKYATTAEKLNPQNFNAVKYAAVLTGDLTEHLPIGERIKAGHTIKSYLDRALTMQPNDVMLRHMRGRFRYAVASLSWMERTMAAAFFATPPTATYDEAIADFLEVERLKPTQWISNLLYLGKSYLAKSDKTNAIKYLKQAEGIKVASEADREALEEVKALIRKHSK